MSNFIVLKCIFENHEEAYWTMNEGEGETITDESGQNTGTLTNVGCRPGRKRAAVQR